MFLVNLITETQNSEFLVAFLEELTGFLVSPTIRDKFSVYSCKFNIYEKHQEHNGMPFAIISFVEDEDDDEILIVKFGGENYFFDLADKNWIDGFQEIWQRKVEDMERRIKRKADRKAGVAHRPS